MELWLYVGLIELTHYIDNLCHGQKITFAPTEDLNQPAQFDQSSLSVWRNQNELVEDSYHTARRRNLIRIFAGHTCPKLRFLALRLFKF